MFWVCKRDNSVGGYDQMSENQLTSSGQKENDWPKKVEIYHGNNS